MVNSSREKIKNFELIAWILFALVIIALYFFALDIPLLGPDEPRYSQVAREMFERGDWITTTLGGYKWFEKPALLYWLQIVSYKIFGVSEFAARFGSALFGLGTIASLWVLGFYRGAENPSCEENATHKSLVAKYDFANWLALIGASSLGLIVFSRGASFDIILTFPITASLIGFFISTLSERKSPITYHLSLITFYFFIGIALIAKGLVGAVFPFAITAFYFALRKKFPSKTFLISLVWGVTLCLLVAAIWYLPMYLKNGWEFIDEFFVQHHFQRYASNKYLHPQPFWFFWVVLPAMTIPWIPFFFAAIWNFVKDLFFRRGAKTQIADSKSPIADHKLRLFAVAWMLVPLVFFSLSGSKLPGYILPALPAACILTGEYVYRFVKKSAMRKFVLRLLAFLIFAVIAFLLEFALPKFAENDSVKGLISASKEKGFATEKILNLQTISHSAEFYGAGRLVRESDGKQRRFENIAGIEKFMKEKGLKKVLVLAPNNSAAKKEIEKPSAKTKIIKTNEEHTIFLLEAKQP